MENKTQFVSVSGGEMFITSTNVHIRNGLGATNGNPADPSAIDPLTTQVNGKGNLIIGYNEAGGSYGDERGGSHNLVIGNGHDYTSFGGLVAGQRNALRAPYASVSGGWFNVASGSASTVSGGIGLTQPAAVGWSGGSIGVNKFLGVFRSP